VRPDDSDEISVLRLVNVVLRHRGLVLGTALFCFATLFVVTLLQTRTYRSASALLPKSRGTTSNLAGLAAQFGVALPTSEGTESPDFYVELLDTRNILGQAVGTTYTFPSDSGPVRGTLEDFYKIKGKTAALRRERGIERLRDAIKTQVGKTGVVSLGVTTRDAALSEQVNRRLVELLQQFNLETRQSQARAERRFTEQRLDQVRSDLREAEDRLQGFLQRNRDLRNSPVLLFEQERLTREVSRQQQLYNTLSEAYESAKIEEVRDTPVLTVVEPPDLPARPVTRGVLKKSVMALAVGLLLGVLLAFARDLMLRSGQAEGDEFAEFTSLRHAALDDLLHPWRPLRRLARRRRSGSPLSGTHARRQAGGSSPGSVDLARRQPDG
jgi:uncharacterized protein involved in exopolysaccharide biosynthesis